MTRLFIKKICFKIIQLPTIYNNNNNDKDQDDNFRWDDFDVQSDPWFFLFKIQNNTNSRVSYRIKITFCWKSWRIYIDDEYLRVEEKKRKSFIGNQPYCLCSRFIYFHRCSFFNESKKQLNIKFLAGHFSLLNENPLTVFTVGYHVKRGLFITPLFVVWSLVVFFSSPIPFFSHVSIPSPFPPFSFILPSFTLPKYRRLSSFWKWG